MTTYTTATTSARSDRDRVRRALVGLEVFLAAGAALGAVGLVSGAIDLGESTAELPFSSPVLAGVALALVNGVAPLVVARAELYRRPWAAAGHVAVGLALVAWIVVQVAVIGLGSWLQVAYGLYGAAIVGLGVIRVRAEVGLPSGQHSDLQSGQREQPSGDSTTSCTTN